MRRHSSLRNLSSDHHTALVQAQRLKRAAHADIATQRKLVSDFLQFWEHHGQRHFCEEEQALLPFYARWGDLEQAPIQQMLREHALIRRDVQLLQGAADAAAEICAALGEQLEAHVRLEERVVFPLIEAALDEQALAALLETLEKWHAENSSAEKEEKPMPTKTQQQDDALPGADLQTHKMPGHWLLARLGKKVLRPGGIDLTRRLLASLDIQAQDDVVEFAPGLGATTELALQKNPASYVAVERDETAAANLRRKFSEAKCEFRTGSANDTGLPDGSASVVYGEAMLTMQTPEIKKQIVGEAARLLRPGGCYGIHELCLVPDDLDEETQRTIYEALSGSIHVGARPLRVGQWRALLEEAGLAVTQEHHAPMELLEPARLIQDEGLGGALHIIWNALHDEEALARVREMRAVFSRYRDHLSAVALTAQKPG